MNNPSGLSSAEMMALMGLVAPVAPNRNRRRTVGKLHGDDNKPKFDRRRSQRRAKNRDARRARAKLRAKLRARN